MQLSSRPQTDDNPFGTEPIIVAVVVYTFVLAICVLLIAAA